MEERSLDWNEIVGKMARGKDNIDLGEVKAVGQLNVLVQKGALIKETHYLPKYLVQDYNGQIVWFDVSEEQLKGFEKEQPPAGEDYTKYRAKDMPAGAEAVIPVLEERLQVAKKNVTEEVIIVKEPVTEYKLISVPITREEIRIVRRPIEAGADASPVANDADRARGILEQGDVEEGLNAASSIGDDRLQMQSQGHVTPDSFTHGTSAQRTSWFKAELDSGSVDSCDTFAAMGQPL